VGIGGALMWPAIHEFLNSTYYLERTVEKQKLKKVRMEALHIDVKVLHFAT